MKSICKRIYNKDNKLIYELCDNEETIIKYDDKGNEIYAKNWNIKTKDIWYERFTEYDNNSNLIHFNDIANNNEYFRKYDENNRCILTSYPNGEYIKFEYDSKGNLIKDIDDNGNITIYENKYDSIKDYDKS